jgi:hypothetical protein
MDAQIVELTGRHYLIGELLQAGLEVAMPIRDRGIDLIAYADIDERVTQFVACPIQMKAATHSSFALLSKYSRVRNLILAYVWHLDDLRHTVTYALTYKEGLTIAESLGWTETPSWRRGAYCSTSPSAKLVTMLEPHRMTPEKWWNKITGLS